MARIERVGIAMVDLVPQAVRSDAIQSFVSQETPIVTILDSDGVVGTGYSYTIGQGGSSIVALLRDHLCPRLIGRDPERIEAVWSDLFWFTHALGIGPVTALAIAAIDVALWDLAGKRSGRSLWSMAGGAKERIPVYDTEGGWLHLSASELAESASAARERGFRGVKVKVGKPSLREDLLRLEAARGALGPDLALMTDANQGFAVAEAIRRAGAYQASGLDLAWFEEPLPAEDVEGHVRLSQATTIPVAIGESLYHPAQFRDYLARNACGIVQVDVARVGGITPWLKTAHLAETFNVAVAPHFLMELHLPLVCAVPNGAWLEHIPQLDRIATSRVRMVDGHALPSSTPGHGIEWDDEAILRLHAYDPIVVDEA